MQALVPNEDNTFWNHFEYRCKFARIITASEGSRRGARLAPASERGLEP